MNLRKVEFCGTPYHGAVAYGDIVHPNRIHAAISPFCQTLRPWKLRREAFDEVE